MSRMKLTLPKLYIICSIIICSFASCSKTEDTILRYPKTELSNSKWKNQNSKKSALGIVYYDYIKFNGTTSVDLYSIDLSGKTLSSKTYPVTIILSDKNMDRFDVTVENGRSASGFTTDNIKLLSYENYMYDKID